jgi:hypothetical protein
MNRMRRILYLFSISSILLLSSYQVTADDQKVSFAKSLTAKDYDNALPSIPIEKWLRSTLQKDILIEWGTDITDCGERTGNPEIDKIRDVPLCAEVKLKKDNTVIGYLLFFIGTENEGMMKEKAALYYGYFNSDNKQITIRKLSELNKY